MKIPLIMALCTSLSACSSFQSEGSVASNENTRFGPAVAASYSQYRSITPDNSLQPDSRTSGISYETIPLPAGSGSQPPSYIEAYAIDPVPARVTTYSVLGGDSVTASQYRPTTPDSSLQPDSRGSGISYETVPLPAGSDSQSPSYIEAYATDPAPARATTYGVLDGNSASAAETYRSTGPISGPSGGITCDGVYSAYANRDRDGDGIECELPVQTPSIGVVAKPRSYGGGSTYVRGYYRKNGTYVRGHSRRRR